MGGVHKAEKKGGDNRNCITQECSRKLKIQGRDGGPLKTSTPQTSSHAASLVFISLGVGTSAPSQSFCCRRVFWASVISRECNCHACDSSFSRGNNQHRLQIWFC
uniref:Uncharacterized protein n=1 Tax=Physcomitrium patens TaxID=3218 RepID=A0A2K1KU90_PHYPA|nr:hypothetical protein PHYPA_004335 [Physcomitrium patens]